MSQRARWTIIATACLLLLMCLLLVGVTLRMAPLIDDMGKWKYHIYSFSFASVYDINIELLVSRSSILRFNRIQTI